MWEFVALYVAQAIALPVVKSCVLVWTRLYTLAAPDDERACRRAEVLSDLHEQISSSRAEGVGPAGIAVCVLLRMLWGFKDDVAWFLPYLPRLMAEKLEVSGTMLSRIEIPVLVVPSLAVLVLWNGGLLIPGDGQTERDWVSTNISAVVHMVCIWILSWGPVGRLTGLVMKSNLLWALTLFAFTGWVWDIHHSPIFYNVLFAVAPILLAIAVNEKVFRMHAFKDQRWPVFLSWGTIVAISLGIAWITENMTVLLGVWGLIGLVLLIGVVVYLVVIYLIVGVVYGSINIAASGMRLTAAGIRRFL